MADWNLAGSLPDILSEHTAPESNHATFYAHYLGYCPRQIYTSKLGLRETHEWRGRFQAGRVVHDYLTDCLEESCPRLQIDERTVYDAGRVRFVGRCTAYDPAHETVYHAKPRNGWYKFHPPVDRHITQLHVYMGLVGADRGQLAYVSMSDLRDVRRWPPADHDRGYEPFDPEQFNRVVRRAEAVHDAIVANGVATSIDEIAFPKCGCYLCDTEDFRFPESTAGAEAPPLSNSVTHSMPANPAPSVCDGGMTPAPASGSDNRRDPDGLAEPVLDDSTPVKVVETDTRHVPRGLREFDVWVTWDGRQKVALAPWQSGTMYPCRWAADSGLDPRRDYETAQMVAEMPVEQIHESWPFPDGDDLPERVDPAVLLPHEPEEPPVVFVDFDDVRDPETGETTAEAVDLVEDLGGYAEVSRSGTGVHVYVRGALPEGVRTVSAPLHEAGHIEVYERSRFTGGTWRHLQGTPLDEVPEAQSVIEQLVNMDTPAAG